VTDRNLIKRRFKSILLKHLQGMRPVDILFFPKPDTIKLRFADLNEELMGILQKAGIYADFKRNK
jgi:ribonuclease P protein component